MAQAGLFVACSQLQLKPYTKIFTRILNNDLTFLGSIIFRSRNDGIAKYFSIRGRKFIILGHLLCSGTEHYLQYYCYRFGNTVKNNHLI